MLTACDPIPTLLAADVSTVQSEENLLLYLLLLMKLIDLTLSAYDHGSTVIIRPSKQLEQAEFGFTVAYQAGVKKLVIGAPKADLLGKVFSCDVNNINIDTIQCNEDVIDVTKYNKTREKNANQMFYFGASISATSQYYIACAPLWTASVISVRRGQKQENIHGTCFLVFVNGTTSRYWGTLEQYMTSRRRPYYDFSFIGGTGWSTLIDEKNNLLLVAKTSLTEDFTYTHQSNPEIFFSSHVNKQMMIIKKDKLYREAIDALNRLTSNGIWKYWNVGFAFAAGNFFSNETVYAFSMLAHTMKGAVGFFRYDSQANLLSIITDHGKDWTEPYTIEETSRSVTSMFGVALATHDLNFDGLADLLVGAPAHSYFDCDECGAFHIYLGDTMEIMRNTSRIRTVISEIEFSRFGTSILARDLNGDSKAEIMISAPYENSGRGAIYIFDGLELFDTLMTEMTYMEVKVSDIRFTRRLEGETQGRLGFSMQIVPDTDGNGCDELAAGAPGENIVILYRCLNTINVTVEISMLEDRITLEHTSFAVEVCAVVKFQTTSSSVSGGLTISNSIFGQGIRMSDSDTITIYSLSTDRRDYCSNVTVEMTDHEPEQYTFAAKATLSNNATLRPNLVINPHSILQTSLNITRHCEGDCTPQLSMNLTWSGQNPYVVGSSSIEKIVLHVWNEGGTSYGSCVKISLNGTKVARVNGCERDNGETDKWTCELPKSMKKNNLALIDFYFDMTKVTNEDENLTISTTLYDKCHRGIESTHNINIVNYIIDANAVLLKGSTNDMHVSRAESLDFSHPIETVQEYSITNDGNIIWKNITAELYISNQPFIEATKVSFVPLSTNNCIKLKKNTSEINDIVYNCNLDLLPNMTLKIVATQFIAKKDIGKYLPVNEASNSSQLNVTSLLKLSLTPTDRIPENSVNTTIVFHKEKRQLKTWEIILIGVVAALLLLVIMAFIMYKVGFFKRKQKERLKSLRESVRRRSSRRYLSTLRTSENCTKQEGLQDMDIGADCAFDDPPTLEDGGQKKKKRTRKKAE